LIIAFVVVDFVVGEQPHFFCRPKHLGFRKGDHERNRWVIHTGFDVQVDGADVVFDGAAGQGGNIESQKPDAGASYQFCGIDDLPVFEPAF